ncbi:MAG: hypothetical protein E7258_09255 [Lachnospiraceae bacterium]|nr:hypothetical protein [Lachnospiraceae bacterium]
MPLLLVFMIWYFGFARNNPKSFKNMENKVGKIIGGLIAFSILTSIFPVGFGLSIALIAILVSLAPPIIFFYVIYKIFTAGKVNKTKMTFSSYRDNIVYEQTATKLARSVPKRRKIVKKFNKLYKLNLSEEEINRIVDASYISYEWEKEIADMENEYATIFQWFKAPTGWLRAYFAIFPLQKVSTDFIRQKQICLDTYNQIFSECNPSTYASIEDCISAINNKYFTSFDEMTFMIAYRFLEANGHRYNLPSENIVRNDSDLDNLRRKYDATSDAKVSQRTRYPM